MNSLNIPKGPPKRSSTSELHEQSCKRAEIVYGAGDQDSHGEDDVDALFKKDVISTLMEKLRLDREMKKKEQHLGYVQREGRKRRRLLCCSCQAVTGFNGN